MKQIITTLFLILIFNSLTAQEIKLKDDKVLLDKKEILKYEKINNWQYSFYTLEDNEEIIMYKVFDNETIGYNDDDFYIINFLTYKTKVQSTDFTHIISGIGMNSRKNMEKMIKWLLKEKVLTFEGSINPDKLETFSDKYDEQIRERTTR